MAPFSPWVLSLLLLAPVPRGDDGVEDDLTDLSLEELLDLEVTTVSRKTERLADSPAAVYVITQEDIRRSGLTSIPEVLRMAPGVHVARINSNSWAISIRGFNGRFANKLLVMIDGRSVYTNLFSGVFWDEQDLVLEDIERVEVVRGPGGSVWGANAVNGVINIITKSSRETQGTYTSLTIGDEDRWIASARLGGKTAGGKFWRAYAKYTDRDNSAAPDALGGGDFPDQWTYVRGGFRFDWDTGERDSFTVQGDVYNGRTHELTPLVSPVPPLDVTAQGPFDNQGGNILGRWTRILEGDSDLRLQAYLDLRSRDSEFLDLGNNTVDVDFQHRFQFDDRNEVVWGLGYRFIDSEFDGTPALDLDPEERKNSYFSGFIQDELAMNDDWSLFLGTKIEHNPFTDFQVSPSARVLWAPDDSQRRFWAAVSRAVRTPSLINEDLVLPVGVIPGTPNTVATLFGDSGVEAEELIAYEVGYRCRPIEPLILDITAFYNDYDDLITGEPGTPFFDGTNIVAPIFFENKMTGESYGVELASTYDVTSRWRLSGTFSWMHLDLKLDSDSQDALGSDSDEYPAYLASLRSLVDVSETVDFDVGLYAVDGFPGVANYVRGDARVAWRPRADLELSVVLQNAFDAEHEEYFSDFVSTASEIERAAYLRITWSP